MWLNVWQAAVALSEAMDIPSLAAPSPEASNAMAIQDKKLAEQATKQRTQNSGPVWGGPSWPMAGSQAARSMALGSSPYGTRFMEPFGSSMDMADASSHFPGSGEEAIPLFVDPRVLCGQLRTHVQSQGIAHCCTAPTCSAMEN